MIIGLFNKAKQFILEDLWKHNLEDENDKRKVFLFRQLRILFLAAKEFTDKKVQSQASALTFYTLLSIVPVIAMAFGIAKGFGFQETLEKEIMAKAASSNQVVWEKLMDFSQSMLANTKGGLVAGIGVVVLFWSVMKLLINIEGSFNDIWGVKRGRSWTRKFTDYIAIMIISPILLLVSGSVSVFIQTQIEGLAQTFEFIGFFAPVITVLFRLTPYILIWTTFSLLYIILPNTKVNIRSAIIAGVIAGTLFQVFEWLYITLQVGVAQYNAIYGSFAALPLFLVWLQFSWLIVLLGCDIAFANQNIEQYEQELGKDQLSLQQAKKLGLLLMFYIIKRFEKGEPPLSSEQLAHESGFPLRLIRPVLFDLVNAQLLLETGTDDDDKMVSYVPARDIHQIKISDVILGIDTIDQDEWTTESASFKKLNQSYNSLFDDLTRSSSNIRLMDVQ